MTESERVKKALEEADLPDGWIVGWVWPAGMKAGRIIVMPQSHCTSTTDHQGLTGYGGVIVWPAARAVHASYNPPEDPGPVVSHRWDIRGNFKGRGWVDRLVDAVTSACELYAKRFLRGQITRTHLPCEECNCPEQP